MSEQITYAGTIVGRDGAIYLVATGSGATKQAWSDSDWPMTAQVMVVAGVIVGRAGKPQPSRIYEV